MLNKQEQSGSHNQQSGRDIINNNFILPMNRYDSMIGTLLQEIYNSAPVPKFSPPIAKSYTIKDKIKHNEIKVYQTHYAIYTEKKLIIRGKIEQIKQQNTDVEQKIYDYVLAQYLQVWVETKASDEIISELAECIEKKLMQHDTNNLSGEQLSYIPHIIFFVFSECKIFEAPN